MSSTSTSIPMSPPRSSIRNVKPLSTLSPVITDSNRNTPISAVIPPLSSSSISNSRSSQSFNSNIPIPSPSPSSNVIPLPIQTSSLQHVSNTSYNEDIVSMETDNSLSSNITLYSRLAHVNKQYPNGTNDIDLPKSVKLESISLIDDNGVNVPFTYIPEANIGNSIIGHEARVIKRGEAVTGDILSFNDNNITLINGNTIISVSKFDQVEINTNEKFSNPRLELDNNYSRLTLSYLLSDIYWKCVGTAIINDIGNMLTLNLSASVTNNTGDELTSNLSFINGNLYDTTNNNDNITARVMMKEVDNNNVETTLVEDYVKYDVGKYTIHNKDLISLNKSYDFPVIKIYTHDTRSDNIVEYMYRFTPAEYLPACDVNIYKGDSNNNISDYLGSSSIKETRGGINNNVDLVLGQSTVVRCQSQIIVIRSSEDNGQQKIHMSGYNDENIVTSITNTSNDQASFILRHYVGNKNIVRIEGDQYMNRVGGVLEWYYNLPPNTTNTFRVTLYYNE